MKSTTTVAPVIDFDSALSKLKVNRMTAAEMPGLVSELGSVNPAYFHNKFEGGLRLQQVPAELSQLSAHLLQRFAGKRIRYLEVGVGSCGTLIFFGHLFRKHGIEFIPSAVDDFSYTSGGLLTDQRERVRWCEENLGLQFLESDSSQSTIGKALADKRYDLILIDADHSFEGCLADFLTYLPNLERTGVMLFHDITACPQAVGEVYEFAKNSFSISSAFSEEKTCGIGLLDGWSGELPSAVSVAKEVQRHVREQAKRALIKPPFWRRVSQKLRRMRRAA